VNRAGERLLARGAAQLLGRTAAELGLASCLAGEPVQTSQLTFPGGMGRWSIRRSSFRQGGLPHQLVVLTDLSRALRDEERQAWQRIVRVIGHELNNSLAPIKSLATSMASLLTRQPPPDDWRADMQRGLAVISARADSLSRFMEAYARLARLPPPRRQPLAVGEWIRRTASLETRLAIAIRPGPEIAIQADGDQLEQLLINLLRNAVDAVLDAAKAAAKPLPPPPDGEGTAPALVSVAWARSPAGVEVTVEDSGRGVTNPANLFVPFFTTKPGGSGIGLVLCRQIAEAHGGTVTLENRAPGPGCVARLRLPLGG
jgi:signal transduction histidine kinase